MITKEQARSLREDFIPNGRPVDMSTLTFRRTTADEVYRCAWPSSYDPQSGTIWCGDIAEWFARTERGYLALCGSRGHVPPKRSES